MAGQNSAPDYDVVIIGGGPAGSTVGGFLAKYNPELRVAIIEKAKFPREHVGESLLPPVCEVLHELGVWDTVEAANFPIKIGATYRWGSKKELWDFEFLPPRAFPDAERPGKFEGPRRMTAFQVDRAIYDDILLRNAEERGCEVFEETRVSEVRRDGDRITSLVLSDGREIRAKYYIDCSGNVGVIRKAMDVKCNYPKTMRNMAVWDYWENAEWAVSIGVGGTRVQVLSIGCGWLWFIPLGPTRTSIGFVCPVDYYKDSGKSYEELYEYAISQEPRIQELIANATREGNVRGTKDWSYTAERLVGENWFLTGESAGFADPILAGGMTLAQTGARETAYILLELLGNEHESQWLKSYYTERQRERIKQYIRFAEYWYSANGQFEDLQGYSAKIAADAGFDLDPKQAFRWLSLGGFLHEDFLSPGLATLDLLSLKQIGKFFSGEDEGAGWEINKFNSFKLNLLGAKNRDLPVFHEGTTRKISAYQRGARLLPAYGMYGAVIEVLKKNSDFTEVYRALERVSMQPQTQAMVGFKGSQFIGQAMSCFETMLLDGWVTGKVDAKKPRPQYSFDADEERCNLHWNYDERLDEVRGKSGATADSEKEA